MRRPSRWKRAIDIGLGAALAALLLPLFVMAGLAVLIADGRPVLFWQRRVGRGGGEFWLPKLRTMRAGAEALRPALADANMHGPSITFKMKADPRVTAVGRVLRILSLDELPQFWCVFCGHMSLVGPRPALPSEVQRYADAELGRLAVTPGLTGLWQVSGRSTIPFEGQVALDLEYIQRQGLWLDLAILVRTVPAVLSCRGAW